eukprot:TRINITY_DN385_c0_g1_i2.p1 TRINITY_DN385_c0_g1~~TRINITY_DN385_c0_g1_i2.p1  ORF type:complete len:356 (-),score=164.65 TRINITY_DN385_c0_g1_i2:1152-2129(-)
MLSNQFNNFIKQYNKIYKNENEYLKRFKIFKENLIKINNLNNEKNGIVYSINQFADFSVEEFRIFLNGGEKKMKQLKIEQFNEEENNNNNNNHFNFSSKIIKEIPINWDWTSIGAVTPVKNQGNCGGSWAYSAIGSLEGVWKVAGNELIGLSENQFIDCGVNSFGCAGGWPATAFDDCLQYQQGSVDSESGYPSTNYAKQCAYTIEGQGAKFTSYQCFCTIETQPCSENDMAITLYNYGPLSVCFDANSMQFYSSGIDNGLFCNPIYINHCAVIVGYGVDQSTGIEYWKIKNSWGTSWGESGYYRIVRGKGACAINAAVTIPFIN